jgi:NADH dehydrogenase [ubiquinone] 1 alpha subcomplex assembly factor 7
MVMVIAHEFFDALPIHILEVGCRLLSRLTYKKTAAGWRELLVDINEERKGSPNQLPLFKLVRANTETMMSKALPSISPRYESLREGSRVELSTDALSVMSEISQKIHTRGAMLIIDYGTSTIPVDTLRGIKHHKVLSPFMDPGNVDISADVDFTGLKEAAEQKGAHVWGPVYQGDWLHSLGIGARASMLAQNSSDPKSIEVAYNRLVGSAPGGMGKSYKVMAVTASDSAPVGFGGSVDS